jgi:hypothetical protein
MRKLTANLVQMVTATTGTGSATCTALAGWDTLTDRFASGDKFYYSITDGNNREVGKSTHGGGNTLVRTTILETLVSGVYASPGTAITLSGNAIVRVVAPEQLISTLLKLEPLSLAASAALADGYSYAFTVNGIVGTLAAAPVVNDRLEVYQAAAALTGCTIDPNGLKINGSASVMALDVDGFSFQLIYTGATYGWKVIV